MVTVCGRYFEGFCNDGAKTRSNRFTRINWRRGKDASLEQRAGKGVSLARALGVYLASGFWSIFGGHVARLGVLALGSQTLQCGVLGIRRILRGFAFSSFCAWHHQQVVKSQPRGGGDGIFSLGVCQGVHDNCHALGVSKFGWWFELAHDDAGLDHHNEGALAFVFMGSQRQIMSLGKPEDLRAL